MIGRGLLNGWTVADQLGEITAPTLMIAGTTATTEIIKGWGRGRGGARWRPPGAGSAHRSSRRMCDTGPLPVARDRGRDLLVPKEGLGVVAVGTRRICWFPPVFR